MPKSVFNALSEEKKARILSAAMAEFSAQRYHEASINQIIKAAEISRGSFYQYFTDKEDLFFFMVNETVQSTATKFMNQYLNHQPFDIFAIYKELLLYNLKMLEDDKYGPFFRNLYLSMNSEFQQKFKQILNHITSNIITHEVGEKMKESRYEEPVLSELINILGLINRDLLETKISNQLDDATILSIYEVRIQIISSLHAQE